MPSITVPLSFGLPKPLSRLLPAAAVSTTVMVFSITALSFILTAAKTLGVDGAAIRGWIATIYGIPAALSFFLTFRYRQPLFVAWSVQGVIFATSLAGSASYAELRGACLIAGCVVFILGALGLTERVARWLPGPIVIAMVAGAVLPYVAGVFTALGNAPVIVGAAFVAYVLGRRLLPARIPPVLPAVVIGSSVAGLAGRLDLTQLRWTPPLIQRMAPAFSFETLAAFAPIAAVLITAQANLPAVVYILSQGYRAPGRLIEMLTGAGTAVGCLFGLTPICMGSFFAVPTAGPEAGDVGVRHWSVYFSAAGFMAIALLAGLAAELLRIVPGPLLLALAGLGLVGVLASTLREVVRGPLVLGPLVTFSVALSHITVLGLGPLFWALVLGTAVSLLLEGEQLRALGSNRTGK